MKKILLGLLISIASVQGFATDIKSVSVFITKAQSQNVTGCEANCHLYELDATENTLEEFFGQLPDNEEEAYAFVMERINTPEWKAYEKSVIESQQIVIKAFELGVTKYPAIVINDTEVSYGITDVKRAIDDFFSLKENVND